MKQRFSKLSSFSLPSLRSKRGLHALLVGLLLFSSYHVTQHELDLSNELDSHEICQVCNLAATPLADAPVFSPLAPNILSSTVLITSTQARPSLAYRTTLHARAPPLS